METYVEQLRRSEAIRASLPRREYLSNDEYRRLKTALTRAKRLGGIAVLGVLLTLVPTLVMTRKYLRV